jgi:hypothetical protein
MQLFFSWPEVEYFLDSVINTLVQAVLKRDSRKIVIIQSVIHHCQNPLDSNAVFIFLVNVNISHAQILAA